MGGFSYVFLISKNVKSLKRGSIVLFPVNMQLMIDVNLIVYASDACPGRCDPIREVTEYFSKRANEEMFWLIFSI